MLKLELCQCWICGKTIRKDKAKHIVVYDLPGIDLNHYECPKCAKNKDLQKGITIGRLYELGEWDNGGFKRRVNKND